MSGPSISGAQYVRDGVNVDGSIDGFTSVIIGDITTQQTVGVDFVQDDAKWQLQSDYTEGGRPFKLIRTGLGDVATASSTGMIAFPQYVGGAGQFLAVDASGELSAATPASSTAVGVSTQTTGTVVDNTVQYRLDTCHSSGILSGGLITDNGDGSVNLLAGEGLLRESDSSVARLHMVNWPTQNFTLVNSEFNYVYMDWNGGTPIAKQSLTAPRTTDQFKLGSVFQEGTQAFISIPSAWNVTDPINKIVQRMNSIAFIIRETNGGGITSITGTRNVAVTAGRFWNGINAYQTTAVDTSVADTFNYWYDQADYKPIFAQTQIDNVNYDNAGVLTPLSNNKYGVHWVYIDIESGIQILYGVGNYTLQEAIDANVNPSPVGFDQHAILAAKIIWEKNAAVEEQIIITFVTQNLGIPAPNNVVNGTGTDNAICKFDTNGNTIQNSGILIDDTSNITPQIDAVADLGDATHRYKDIYISGEIIGGSLGEPQDATEEVVIPTMTSHTTPTLNGVTYTVSSSSDVSPNEPWKVFDTSNSTLWATKLASGDTFSTGTYLYTGSNSLNGISGAWLQILFSSNLAVKDYYLTSRATGALNVPVTWTLMYTTDSGASWTNTHTADDYVWPGGNGTDTATFPFDVGNVICNGLAIVISKTNNVGLASTTLSKMTFGGSIIPGGYIIPRGLQVVSTTEPFTLPTVTTTQRDAMIAATGSLVFNTTTGVTNVYNGSAWVAV